ncbi:cytochrome b/b6 domain-containing protein [Telmatospirillum sp.]|uniref:cytochrome b/b6 domain-containing protein n=1 Tax=Telmatospirillum sp. TaxID=2079197 RepID=UPI00284741C9|nr:cytochrome b/b6 domain-containing protein [Telmatospirillum sp.]MDR3437117.1 cytochrome b/b6 domain-containing protein [Telmatospirillum sp.]
MAHRAYLFAGWIRLWHWTNLVFMLGLTFSGLSLHFADPKVGVIDFNLAQRIHNIFGIALAVSYFFFVVANFATGNWKQFVPKLRGYPGHALLQLRYYLFDIFFGRPAPFPTTPEDHFNPLQKVIYLIVMYVLMPILIITGLMYLWPEMAPDRLFGFDGLLPVAMAHYVVAYFLILFLFAHVYLCTCGTTVTAHFKAMITGWHEE